MATRTVKNPDEKKTEQEDSEAPELLRIELSGDEDEDYEAVMAVLERLKKGGSSKAKVALMKLSSGGDSYDDEIRVDLPVMTLEEFCSKWIPKIGTEWPTHRSEDGKTIKIDNPMAKDAIGKLGALARPNNIIRISHLLESFGEKKTFDKETLRSWNKEGDTDATWDSWLKKTRGGRKAEKFEAKRDNKFYVVKLTYNKDAEKFTAEVSEK